MIPFAERRVQKRYIGGALHGSILNSNDLKVLNISIHGAAIESVRRVELNREYTIRIQFHERSLPIRVRVVWAMLISRVGPDKKIIPLYRAGVKFLHVSDEEVNLIQSCIPEGEAIEQGKAFSRITYCF